MPYVSNVPSSSEANTTVTATKIPNTSGNNDGSLSRGAKVRIGIDCSVALYLLHHTIDRLTAWNFPYDHFPHCRTGIYRGIKHSA